MGQKAKITLSNIKAFLQGYSRLYYDKLVGLPEYIQEQIEYRRSKCEDCVEEGHETEGPGHCKECGCGLPGKWFVTRSCNGGKRFPDLMGEEKWKKFKKNGRE